MKKIITAVAMASLLSGCQLLEQLQGTKQQPSTLPTSSKIELPAAQAQSLDAQFERIKKGNEEVTFNGEKFYKQTKVFDKSEEYCIYSDRAGRCDLSDFYGISGFTITVS